MEEFAPTDEGSPAAGSHRVRIQAGGTSTATTTADIRSARTRPKNQRSAGPGRDRKRIEGAVYDYIQAVRALGRTRITTVEIARALRLPVTAVDRTVANLRHKGVKVL